MNDPTTGLQIGLKPVNGYENIDRNGDEKVSEQEMVDALIESLKARNK